MTQIELGPCECDSRGHIIGASGMCQWCHKTRMELEHAWMLREIEKLTRQRDQARAYASSLAAHLIGCGDELP